MLGQVSIKPHCDPFWLLAVPCDAKAEVVCAAGFCSHRDERRIKFSVMIFQKIQLYLRFDQCVWSYIYDKKTVVLFHLLFLRLFLLFLFLVTSVSLKFLSRRSDGKLLSDRVEDLPDIEWWAGVLAYRARNSAVANVAVVVVVFVLLMSCKIYISSFFFKFQSGTRHQPRCTVDRQRLIDLLIFVSRDVFFILFQFLFLNFILLVFFQNLRNDFPSQS